MVKRNIAILFLCFLPFMGYAQTDLENYFNLCLEFGAPLEVVELYQSFRTYKGENNGSVSYVVREDNSLLKDKPYSEYQIWYTIDKEHGLYQSSLIIRGDRPVLQGILTGYLRKFNQLHGEPVYTTLDNGSILIFWYNENSLLVKARLILDIVNSYKYVSITFCSPMAKHANLLRTLYNGTAEEEPATEAKPPAPSPPIQDTPVAARENSAEESEEALSAALEGSEKEPGEIDDED